MFQNRIKSHNEFQEKAIEEFKKLGFLVNKYGQETNISSEFSNALYKCGDDITAQFIRYNPDLALILFKNNTAYLCELKSSTDERETFALEKNSYEMALLLSKIGIKIFILFGDFTYNFVKNLEWDTMLVPRRFFNKVSDYEKQYPNKKIISIKNTEYGSNTPFILIKKICLKKLVK